MSKLNKAHKVLVVIERPDMQDEMYFFGKDDDEKPADVMATLIACYDQFQQH